MSSFFGGGFDAPHTPLMNQGDEESVEESKEADPSLVDTSNVMEMANPHGDMGHGGHAQAVTQSQHNVLSTTQDWGCRSFESHVGTHVLVFLLLRF